MEKKVWETIYKFLKQWLVETRQMMKTGVFILPKKIFNIKTYVLNVCDHWFKKKKRISA